MKNCIQAYKSNMFLILIPENMRMGFKISISNSDDKGFLKYFEL